MPWYFAVLRLALLFLAFSLVNGRDLKQDQAGGGGFLSKDLPLKVVVSTPSELLQPGKTLPVEDQQALTAVFSRAVIALGEDFGVKSLPDDKIPWTLDPPVPGKFRWVTTYIARWDPEGSWPLDSEIKFRWNEGLRSHDGIPLSTDGIPGEVTFVTGKLTMDIQRIESKKASELTDDDWSPWDGLPDDILPEVPPDGEISLRFNHEVSIDVLNKELKVLDADFNPAPGLQPIVKACQNFCPFFSSRKCEPNTPGESFCAIVSIRGDMKVGTRYNLNMAIGVKYSQTSGPLKTAVNVGFGGLKRFRIPMADTRVTSPFVIMQLYHGLDSSISPEENIAKIKPQVKLSTADDGAPVEFDLSFAGKGGLRIVAPLQPNTLYKLEVEGSDSVLDGYGIPLESSVTGVLGEGIQSRFNVFKSSRSMTIFESGQDWGQKVVVSSTGKLNTEERQCAIPEGQANIYSVFDFWRVRGSMAVLDDSVTRSTLAKPFGPPSQTAFPIEDSGTGVIQEYDISELLAPTGIIAFEFCSFLTEHHIMVESDVQAVVVGSRVSDTIVWLTSMSTGDPIVGANVAFYKNLKENYQPDLRQPDDYELVVSQTTDAKGKALFTDLPRRIVMVVEDKDKKTLLVPNIRLGFVRTDNNVEETIILDRKLVKPGDTLHVKGYALNKPTDNLEWKPNNMKGVFLTIRPPLDPDSTESFQRIEIEPSPKFGSFEARVAVPLNAENQGYSMFLNRGPDSFFGDFQTDFTVGDPRPPTVELTIDAPQWAQPDSKIKVDLLAESFVGSAVGDAELTVRWRVQDNRRFDEALNDEVVVTTNAKGEANVDIDLSSRGDDTPTPGSTLNIDVQWVGPTRELIEEKAVVWLELADLVLSLDRTVNTDFPKQEFGVKVTATDLLGEPRKPEKLTVDLKERLDDVPAFRLPAVASKPLDGAVKDSCTVTSNSDELCRFALPDVGRFALELCVNVNSTTLCERTFLGNSQQDLIDQRAISGHIPIGFAPIDLGPHKVGDVVQYGIENPYMNAKAIVVWGSTLGSKHKIVNLDDNSYNVIDIKVDKNCIGKCAVIVGVSVPRQFSGLAVESDLKIAKRFDLAMPHSRIFTDRINVETDTSLNVSIALPGIEKDKFILPPGESTDIEVQLDDKGQEAEILVVAVDKSVLELISYPLQDAGKSFEVDFSVNYGTTESSDFLAAPQVNDALIKDFSSKKELDPWFNPVTRFNTFPSTLDFTRQQYIENESQRLETRQRGQPLLTGKSAARRFISGSPSIEVIEGAEKERAPFVPPRLRLQRDFVTTALFKTVVSDNGMARVNFTAPDNLGVFVIRAYAASGTGKFGSVETSLVVRRKLSITPTAPRFARVGDVFEAGAVITVSGAKDVFVKVEMEGESGKRLRIEGASEGIAKLGDDGTEEIRFTFVATSTGEATFKITADDGAGSADALEITIPIEGVQEAVTLASSFAVDGSGDQKWQEGLQLPEAVNGSGIVKVQAGVGRLPAILSLAGQLHDANPDHLCPISASYALAVASIPLITESYDVFNLDKKALGRSSAEVVSGIVSNFTAAVETLEKLTDSSLGLLNWLSCLGRIIWRRESPSIFLNSRAVWLLNELDTAKVKGAGEQLGVLKSIKNTWRSALEGAVVGFAEFQRRENQAPLDTSSVVWSRAALGGDWNPPGGLSDEIKDDLSMERLSREFDSLNVESQAFYILTRMKMKNGMEHPDVQKAFDSWTSNFRVGARTAYVAAGKGSPYPASNIANALVLAAFSRGGQSNALIEKLANHVGGPPVGQYGFRFFGNLDAAVAMIAIRDYDVFKGNDQPDVKLRVRSGATSLLNFRFKDSSKPVVSSVTPWEALDSPPKPLEFLADGTGEVTLAATLNFIPARLLPFPTYKGFFVQRSIQIAGSNGPSLAVVPVTSIVEVVVQVTTPDSLAATTVRVLMPAGLEPIDPNIFDSNFCPTPRFGFVRYFTCPNQDTRPSVVIFSFRGMNAGTQSVSFRAVAATAGVFSLPPVRALVDDQPELMGLSSAGELTVCTGPECKAVAESPPVIPKTCPKDCNGNGACDLNTGNCLCLPDFQGDDCGVFASS